MQPQTPKYVQTDMRDQETRAVSPVKAQQAMAQCRTAFRKSSRKTADLRLVTRIKTIATKPKNPNNSLNKIIVQYHLSLPAPDKTPVKAATMNRMTQGPRPQKWRLNMVPSPLKNPAA
jgi:cell division protein FtsN